MSSENVEPDDAVTDRPDDRLGQMGGDELLTLFEAYRGADEPDLQDHVSLAEIVFEIELRGYSVEYDEGLAVSDPTPE